jgi:hypothetical protein
MLKAATRIARELNSANPLIYWADLLASVSVGYGALALAATSSSAAMSGAALIVAALAVYRAASFLHKITHAS